MIKPNVYTLEVYQNPDRQNRHFGRVVGGHIGVAGESNPYRFYVPLDVIYNDIHLNGAGRSKALKKVEKRLKADGLVLRLFVPDAKTKVFDRSEVTFRK